MVVGSRYIDALVSGFRVRHGLLQARKQRGRQDVIQGQRYCGNDQHLARQSQDFFHRVHCSPPGTTTTSRVCSGITPSQRSA